MDRLIFLVTLSLVAYAVAATVPMRWNFEKNGLSIWVIGKDAVFDERRTYQVVVSDQLHILARLEVNRDGPVSNVWITDLDNDGAFEIVVATAQLGGGDVGAVDIHEWRGFRFESTKTAELTADQRSEYRGNDQFTILTGRLRRTYPIFADVDGTVVPTGRMAKFEYRYGEDRWEPETR